MCDFENKKSFTSSLFADDFQQIRSVNWKAVVMTADNVIKTLLNQYVKTLHRYMSLNHSMIENIEPMIRRPAASSSDFLCKSFENTPPRNPNQIPKFSIGFNRPEVPSIDRDESAADAKETVDNMSYPESPESSDYTSQSTHRRTPRPPEKVIPPIPPESIERVWNLEGLPVSVPSTPIAQQPTSLASYADYISANGKFRTVFQLVRSCYPRALFAKLVDALELIRQSHNPNLLQIPQKDIVSLVGEYLSKNTKIQDRLGKFTEVQTFDDSLYDNCAICFEKLFSKRTRVLPCRHIFHDECICSWVQCNTVCPVCSASIRLQ